MKMLEVTEKQIGANIFYLKPFPAFTAANISGELAAILAPILSGLAPLFTSNDSQGLDTNMEDAAPMLGNAFSGLSGDKFERFMKKLLIDYKNISVENPETGRVELLTYDLANEVFCGDVQDMYMLCFEVIKLNFSGFFKKLGPQYGGLKDRFQQMVAPSTANTAI